MVKDRYEYFPINIEGEGKAAYERLISGIFQELQDEGEEINPMYWEKTEIYPFLANIEASELKEYIRHSNRYYSLTRSSDLFDRSKKVVIPVSDDNKHAKGQLRREEEGYKLSFEFLKSISIDPTKVLYFRVTQPSLEPKPEYYWTNDASEVVGGLRVELGRQRETAIILVSTLWAIAQNGGLIDDINDDDGIAVRQIGFDVFDQTDALAVCVQQ